VKIIRAIAALPIAALAILLSAGAASAAPGKPVPAVYANDDGWRMPSVRPAAIYFGNGGAPFLRGLNWQHWGTGTAFAEGRLWTQVPGCTKPSYQCPYGHRWASVRLHGVKTRDGVRYFAGMDVRFFTGGHAEVRHLVFGSRGFWNGPARWPWL
jgi:hypothetical protein